MRWWNFIVCLALVGEIGCGRQSYPARGVIQKIAVDQRSLTIAHEAIPGYMMAMTMDFPVKDAREMRGLHVGDVVTFELAVRGDEDWVEHIKATGQTVAVAGQASPAAVNELKPGDLMPDFAMITEDGMRRHLSDFHGQAVAFTFFFTSCPLPDYCPRMNRNFAGTREILTDAARPATNWEFLSISFDASFDTPEVLANYAPLYRGTETNHWLFAVIGTNTLAAIAPRLDLMVMRAGGSISHNLRTVVLDTQGRIYKQFDDNKWTPQELAEAMTDATRAR